ARYHSRVRVRSVVGDRRETRDRNAEERCHDGRIELRIGTAPDLLTRRVDQEAAAVGAVARHRVERVTDCEDARAKRDAIALESVRVAHAVPAFMVVTDDARDVLEE